MHPQHGVKGLSRQRFAAGGKNCDLDPACIAIFLAHSLHALRDHAPRGGVDGPFAHWLIQPGFGHAANALASLQTKPGRNFARAGIEQKAVCNIRVITGILLHGALGKIALPLQLQRLYFHSPAFGGHKGKLAGCLAREQQLHRPGCCQRRAGARGIAAAQLTLPAANAPLKRHGTFSPFSL